MGYTEVTEVTEVTDTEVRTGHFINPIKYNSHENSFKKHPSKAPYYLNLNYQITI